MHDDKHVHDPGQCCECGSIMHCCCDHPHDITKTWREVYQPGVFVAQVLQKDSHGPSVVLILYGNGDPGHDHEIKGVWLYVEGRLSSKHGALDVKEQDLRWDQ